MKLLNLGCGWRHHPAWVNLDMSATENGVVGCNLRQGIPYATESFDVVYHSHLLEHFERDFGEEFMRECARVLRPSGIIRVVVPDLEGIVRAYTSICDRLASGGDATALADHEWILFELYDQAVRHRSGGGMEAYLKQAQIPNEAFVLGRIGAEGRQIIERARAEQQAPAPRLDRVRRAARALLRPRETLTRLVLGREYAALVAGRFRLSGEVHLWAYDAHSLRCLLERCGFTGIQRRTAADSYVEKWPQYNLDTDIDGTMRKPDSLFMEGVKR